MVLDGTLDPREYVGRGERFAGQPLGARIEQTLGGSEVFAEFLRRCAAAGPSRCSLAALGDPASVARATVERLKVAPVTITFPDGSTFEVTYQVAVAVAFSTLSSPSEWSVLADLIAGLALSSPVAAGRAANRLAATAELRRGEDYPSYGNVLSTCVDTVSPRPRLYPAAADTQDALYPDFGRYRTWVGLPCFYLNQAGIGDQDAYLGPWRQPTNARVLVLGTRWDPATPYRNTRPYADLFRRAAVVTLEGWGHTTIGKSRCADAAIEAYLIAPKQARADVTCLPDQAPFAAPMPLAATGNPARDVIPAMR